MKEEEEDKESLTAPKEGGPYELDPAVVAWRTKYWNFKERRDFTEKQYNDNLEKLELIKKRRGSKSAEAKRVQELLKLQKVELQKITKL